MDLMMPRAVQHVVDEAIAKADSSLVLYYGLFMFGATVMGIFGGVMCGFSAIRAAMGFGADLRHALYKKIQSFSFGNLDELDTGSLITRVTNDVTQVQDIVSMVLRGMIRAPLLLIGGLTMAILTSPQLALLFLGLVPVVIGFLIFIIRRTYPIYGEVQRRLDRLNSRLQENLEGVRVVKAFARAKFEEERFDQANDSLRDGNLKAARFGVLPGPFMMVVLNVGVVAALWIGGVGVSKNSISVGEIVAFVNYLGMTLMALMFFSMMLTQLSRAAASAERIVEVLHTEALVTSPADPKLPSESGGAIEFDHVHFAYGDSDEALTDIHFKVEPGQTVAILGSTGAGKSSLVNLIGRYYDPTQGTIRLDGLDLREYEESVLRQRIGIAFQEAVLFSGSIRDNIRYGKPDATEVDVELAAEVSQASEFIRSKPDGYDTEVGQRGVNLSGGQKQRVAIARALVRKPEILILDDSTSAVDMRTEARIQEGLVRTAKGQTRLIVAQRIRSVMHADKILIMHDGRIVAEGTHSELMANSPIYKEIFDSQKTRDEEVRDATE